MTEAPPLSPDQAQALAERVVQARFPDADAAFAAGSFFRGEATAMSDLDLVVLHRRLPRAWRESFVFDGVPVEAFVHDDETLPWFFQRDREAGRAAILDMVATGRIVGPRRDRAASLQVDAAALLAAGPPPLEAAQLDRLRYDITDKLDDLAGQRSHAEILAIGAALYGTLAELILRGHGQWTSTGKWVPKLLRRFDRRLAARFSQVFDALFALGAVAPVIEFADDALRVHGGRLFDGHLQWAAPTARISEHRSDHE